MVLPLYLAMTPWEMEVCPTLPPNIGWMACHFDPDGPGLRDIPDALPPGAMLILNDRLPCRDHDPAAIAAALAGAAEDLGCDSVLLDFEREPAADTMAVAQALRDALLCPLAAPPGFIEDLDCAVFLPSCPLHVPLAEHLRPWRDRTVWLDVCPRQQTITVTRDGSAYGPAIPVDRQGGEYDEILRCQCVTGIGTDRVSFTLFDTPETLNRKLEQAAALGVAKGVGLYQELARR